MNKFIECHMVAPISEQILIGVTIGFALIGLIVFLMLLFFGIKQAIFSLIYEYRKFERKKE